jgi:hypothetical protein
MAFEKGHKTNVGRIKPEHSKLAQAAEMSKHYKCPYCNEVITNKSRIAVHITKAHATKIQWIDLPQQMKDDLLINDFEYRLFLENKLYQKLLKNQSLKQYLTVSPDNNS